MGEIEEVKKILQDHHGDIAFWYANERLEQVDKYMEALAHQICQLFEPNPSSNTQSGKGIIPNTTQVTHSEPTEIERVIKTLIEPHVLEGLDIGDIGDIAEFVDAEEGSQWER